jgi:hypothetical protein
MRVLLLVILLTTLCSAQFAKFERFSKFGSFIESGTSQPDFEIVTGTYEGNGTSQTVSLGFSTNVAPVLVVVKNRDATDHPIHAHQTMIDDGVDGLPFGNVAEISGAITSLDAGSFSVGSADNGNGDGETINYWAIYAAPGTYESGKYSGNSIDDRDISLTNGSLACNMVWVKNTIANYGVFKTTAMTSADTTAQFNTNIIGNAVQSLGTGQFQVGNDGVVNQSGRTYYYIAFGQGADNLNVGNYTGVGTSLTVNFSNGSLNPTVTWVQRATSNTNGIYRTSLETSAGGYKTGNEAFVTGQFTSMTTGSFTLPSFSGSANWPLARFHYFAFGN